jgi:tripartite-type tricarboxylate transporter receptor subunit TctC
MYERTERSKAMACGLRVVLGVIVMAVLFAGPLKGQETYPSKPITFVVPHSSGGTIEFSARLIAEKFKALLGQPVLILNKPGAQGRLGAGYALGQKADGYTVIVGMLTEIFVSPYFSGGDLPNVNEMTFVGGYMPIYGVLFTTPDKPYKTLKELVEYARGNPGKVSVGSGGSRWGMEVMKSIAAKEGLKMNFVTLRGGVEAATAVLGKHVDLCESGAGGPMFQAARQGKLIPLVSLGRGRVPFFPGVKNLKELGYPFAAVPEYGLAVRNGTPEAIRRKLEETLEKVLKDPEVTEKMIGMGFEPRFVDANILRKLIEEAIRSIPELIRYNRVLEERQ